MSKSLGNYIGITDTPDDMFGKIMSVSDDLMWRYFELLSTRDLSEIQAWRDAVRQGVNPRDIKFELGLELVTRFHVSAQAREALDRFVSRFQRGALPEDIPEQILSAGESGSLPIANLLKTAGLVASTSEAIRLIGQGAVRIDGERIEDVRLACSAGSQHVYQVGKRRIARIRLTED
jgi:tyrosyl-tRNA synthetase